MLSPSSYYNALYSLAFSYLAFNETFSTAPVVDLGYARYQGIIDPVSNNINFLGIQYAAGPMGK